MKKISLISVCIFMIFAHVSAVYAESKLIEVDSLNECSSVAAHDNSIYLLLGSRKVMCLQSDTATLQTVTIDLPEGQELDGIVMLNDGLYGYVSGSGMLTRLMTEKGSLPASSMHYIFPISLSWEQGYVSGLNAVGQTVSFLFTSYATEKTTLCQYDLSTKAFQSFELQVSTLYPYDDDRLIIVSASQEQSTLSLFDWSDYSTKEICAVSGNANGLYYNADNELIYYCDNNNLMSVSLAAKSQLVKAISVANELQTSAIIDQRFYVSYGISGMIYLCDLLENQETTTLRVLGESTISQGLQSFIKKHPNVIVDTSRSAAEYPTVEQFVQAFITGEMPFDVMCINTGFFDISLLMKKGYCEDLTENRYFMEQVSRMYPTIQQRVFYGDRLMAIPFKVMTPAWETYNADRWADAGFMHSELPKTYGDFLQYLATWSSRPIDSAENFQLFEFYDVERQLIDMMMKRYTAMYEYNKLPLNFDTELFRSLLDQIDKTAELLDAKEDEYGFYLMSSDGSPLVQPLLALPLSDQAPALISGSMGVYIINSQSMNKNLAVEYVTTCLEELPKLDLALLYPTEAVAIESPYFEEEMAAWEEKNTRLIALVSNTSEDDAASVKNQLLDHQTAKEDILKAQYAVMPEAMMDYCQNVAPKLFFHSPSVFNPDSENGMMLDRIISRYLDDQINADQLIQELNNKVKMMQLEAK